MLEQVDAILDAPVLLFVVLAIGAAIGITIERAVQHQRSAERRAYWQGRNSAKQKPGKSTDYAKMSAALLKQSANGGAPTDAADQLRTVMAADFAPRRLLNRSEAAVFKALDAAVIARNSGWQVMAQVSLGEFLGTDDKAAFAAVNSKRVDFALMDPDCRVHHALEYQGTGHHLPGGAAAARDAVKKEALRKAGIGYHEVVAGHTTPAELRRLVEKLVPADS